MASMLPCCGTGPSCCRWCKDICDDLERSWIPRLWHALCADIDTDDSQKEVMYRMIKDTMFPRPGMVGGAGMSGNQAAMAGMMGGLRL